MGEERIAAIFRYLDPSGEGQISIKEWRVLEQLWLELKLSLSEFKRFLERTYGPELSASWAALDADHSGRLTQEEWLTECKRIGYFGPILQIFRFLDKDDHGSVSLDEFLELWSIQGVESPTSG